MELLINYTKRVFDEDQMSVQTLLDSLCPISQQGIAIAIGTAIISRADWPTTMLTNLDELLLITATQGG